MNGLVTAVLLDRENKLLAINVKIQMRPFGKLSVEHSFNADTPFDVSLLKDNVTLLRFVLRLLGHTA